jgi:putative radical SAM enzyme (TIGR03279 family)
MNMRKGVYFKDDDARLSFLQGSYITLTNLNDFDIERIIKFKLSVNVSVHTTNGRLRKKMLNNADAGRALQNFFRLARAGISMNCQIVVCPGINDGKELEKTLSDLVKLKSIKSIACVPVGLTKFRKNLPELRGFTPEEAGKTIDIIEKFGVLSVKKHGIRKVYPADEFFMIAQRQIPPYDYYESFEQYENGVGMWASFEYEFSYASEGNEPERNPETLCEKNVVTGTMIAPLFEELVKNYRHVKILPIKNNFFGGDISVTGLVTGNDIISQLSGKNLTGELLIPKNMLKADEDIFLDDVTVEELEEKLHLKVKVTEVNGEEFWKALWK